MKKVAVVTGSAKGLGRAIALALAREGFTVVVHYRKSKKEAEKVLREVGKLSAGSILTSGDLTDENQVKEIFDAIIQKFRQVDLLVNNVGNFLYKPLHKTSNREFRDILESNVYTTLFCSKAVLPQMRRQKSGYIVNIGVVGADKMNLLANSTPYFYAKNGVYLLTKMMAHEEAKNGIHVNMISPASLETDIFKPGDFPMGRSATYDDVVKALLFLISPDAYYINGANLEVAGGFIPGLTK
ncbi:SDR family oxidoreductase [Candidatus Curtissbacteria bacterium]|nr:SDR family oxidoreductase [Candidatus Curtissbacteria bacterium]